MAGLSTGAPIVQVYHEKSRILPDVSRVLACLHEKGVKFDTCMASYKSLLKLQASTHAPVPFYDGPTFLEESREICRHIAEKYDHHGYPFLLGKDALERASVEEWLHHEEHAFNPPSRALFCHLAFPSDKDDNADDMDMHKRKLEEVLEVYEQRLSDSEFLAGNMFTLADLVHLPNSHYITAASEFVYLYDSRKNVRRWWDAISKRGSWQQVLMYMKRVEEQNKQEELKEQQQQKNHPRTPGYPRRIFSTKHTTIEPRTVLMHPAGTVLSSPIAPQTEKPLPIDIPDEPLVSSSQRTPTYPFQEKPPQKISPATSPTTSENSPIIGAARFSPKDASRLESTKTDLPSRHKPSSSKDVSNNLHVFDYYKASNHSEEVTAYIESTPQKGSETLDQLSESSIGHTKTSSIPAKEVPDQRSKSDFYKSDGTSTGVDSQDMDPVPYYEHTTQSARSTDTTASKLHTTDADCSRPIQQVKSRKDAQQHPSQDSRQATSRPAPQDSMSMELVEGQAKVTQRPDIDHRRDVSSPLPQQTGGARGIAVDDKASSDQSGALLSPSTQKHTTTPSRKAAAKEAHGTSPPQAGYGGGQDTKKQLRDPGYIARQTAAQSTFGESKAADSMISSGGSSDAFQFPHPRHDLDAAQHTTAPFQKRHPLTEDTAKQTKDIISAPWQMAAQETEDTEYTTKETKRAEASEKHKTTEGLVREKETTEDHHGATSPIHKRHANIKDTTGQFRDIAFKLKKRISQDDGDALKETKFRDPSLLREQPSDPTQAATTTDEETNQDDLNMALPSETTQTIYPSVTASRTRYPIAKDPSKQPRGTLSTPRHKAVQDENDTSEGSTISDKVASSEQPLNAQRAPISPRRQEVDDSPREITSFQKRDRYVEDTQVADTVSQQIPSSGVKDTFEETKIADSSTTNAEHMYTQQSALPPQRQVEVQHAQDKGMQSEVMSPEPHKMVSRGVRDTHGEGKTGTPGEQSSERSQAICQPRPAAAEDARGATGETIQFPDILDITKKSRRTFEETQDAGPTLPRARPLGVQDAPESKTPTADHQRMDVSTQLQSDAQDTFLQSKLPASDQKDLGSLSLQERDAKDLHATLSEEKPVSSVQPREMIKKTQSTAPRAHPIDSQGSIKVEKVPFLYKKKPLFAHDNQDQAQIIPSGGKGDDSTSDREETSDAPYDDETFSAAAPDRAKSHNDFNEEESHKKDTTDDKKVASSLRSKEPISQVQPPSGPSQDADPHGDLSSKLSTIEQWQRASMPLNDMTTNSRDETGMPTLDQKLTLRSQQGSLSGHGANQMAKEPVVEAPILPIEPETSGVQSTSPSFPEAATTHHAFVDDKFAKQSIIDERLGEPKQMQAPIPDARPVSPHTKRKTPDGLETGDLEHVGSSDSQILDAAKATPLGPATIREDPHDASIGEMTTKYDASGDQLVTGPLDEHARPPTPTHEAKEHIGVRRTSKEPELRGSSQAEVVDGEHKSILSDQKPARAAQLLSPVEPGNMDSNDNEPDGTIAPQMTFRQQARPSAPIIKEVLASDSQNIKKKIQEVTPDYGHTEDSGKPLVPSQEDQISHASQAISPQEDKKYSPSARDSPKSDIQPPQEQVHEVAHDDQKVVSPQRSKEPTSQVQLPSGPSQDAAPHGDLSSKLSTIEQWHHASTPLVNQMAKESGEQRVETPILPIVSETSGVQSTSPSFPEAATTDHAIIDDKFVKQSIMDERLGEPKQMQAPIPDARPVSPHTKRKTPDGLETGDLEHVGSSDGQISDATKATPLGPATIREDPHDASIGEMTTKYDASGDQLVTGPLDEQARPRTPTHDAKEHIGVRRTSKEPELRGSSQAEVVDGEHKSILSDQKPARAAQLLSPFEPGNMDSNDNEPDGTIAPQMTFRQQARPSAPIIKAVPASDSQNVKRKIQEATPDYGHTEDSGKPLVPSQEDQISHASQAISPQEDKKYSPSARDSPKSYIQTPLEQVHEVAHDDQKVVSPQRSKEPTSQVQLPSGPSQDAAPNGDLSSKLSTIEQWHHASTPLVNQMAKEPGEQRVETPILPIVSETSGVQSTSPSFPEAATTDHAIIDDKFVKQSIMDERLGEPKQMQAPITDARPASPHTKERTPNGPETGDLEVAGSFEGQILDAAKPTPPGPTTIREDSPDAAIGEMTTKYDASGDQLVTGPLDEQAQPHAPTHEAIEPIGVRRTSKEPELRGSSQAEVVDGEHKSILSDQKPARAAQLLSSVEPGNMDSNDNEPDGTIAPQMTFWQQARPSAPIIKEVPASDSQNIKRKIQEVTPDYGHTEDSGKPLVPSQEDQISHASQAISPQEDKKYSPSARDSPKSDIQPPQEQVHEVAHDDQKVVSPLRSKEPTSQVQFPSGPSQDAAPHGDLSSKLSTIEEWQHASTPLVNQMAKESGEQRVETPILPIESETSGVQSTSPSFPEAATTDHAIIDDKLVKQSIMDERLGEPKQMQAPITDARPASPPTKERTPNGPETGDLEVAGSFEGQILDAAKATPPGPTTIREGSPDAAIVQKTTKYDASGNQLVTGPLHVQAQPHAPTHEAIEPIGVRRTSKEPKLRGSSQAEVVDGEHKSILSDKKPARAAQPLSPVEPGNIDNNDYGADNTIAPQMTFRQQARPSVPIIKTVPASDSQNVKRKIQGVTTDYSRTEDSGQVHEVSRDESSEKQGSHVGSAFGPNELGPSENKFVPSDQGLGHSADDPSSADPRKEYPVAPIAKQIKALQGIIGQQGTPEMRQVPSSEDALDTISTNVDVHPTDSTKASRRSFSVQGAEPTSSAQAPPFHVARDSLHTGTTPDDALGNAVSMKPSASPDARHGIGPGNTTDEVTPAEHKFVPSGQDSVPSKQSPPSTVQRNEAIGDSTLETQQIFSKRPRIGDVATPAEEKGTQTSLDQHEMLSAPSSDTQRPSEKAREPIPSDNLGEAASKPSSYIREVRQPTVVPASAPAAQHGAATDEEALDKQKSVPSGQDSVRSTQPPSSSEQRNGRMGDSTPSTQWISSTKSKKGDVVALTPDQAKDSEITLRGQNILPPARSVSPFSDIQRHSGKAHDVPANDLGEAKPIVQASAPDTQDETALDEAAPDEKKFAPPEPTLSTEPRNEEIRDSAPSTQLISSTEKMKENATIGAPDQGKDLQTTLDQQGIPSETVKSPSPSPDTHRPSKKSREDAPADDLGEATSKTSALVREVRPSTVVPRSAPVTQYGAARDEDLDKQKFVPAGQDSVHSALLRNGEIGDPAPSTQQISSTMPRKGDAAPSTLEQAKNTQITPGRQDILPPVRLESPSSDNQHPSGKVHEDVPADNLREAEPILQASAPDTVDEKNIVPSEPALSGEPRNKEIRDSAPSAQLISSTGTRNEHAIIAAPDQDKDLQTTLDQQDILSTPVRSASPSSDTQHPSEKAREDVVADDLREAASKSLALVREVRPPTVVPASGPATLHGAAPDETAHDEQKNVPSGQDSAQSVQPSFSSEQTKEDTIVTAADQTEDLQTIIHGQNITPSTDTTKTPLPGTKDTSKKIQESTSDDIDIDGSIPGEEQVPLVRDDGHATEPYRAAVYEKTTTSPSSKAYSSESGSDLIQTHTDVHRSIGEGSTETFFTEHGLQTQPPLAISLGASNKAEAAGQEAKAPIASASETQPGSTQPQDEAAPIEQNFVVSDQKSSHASKSPSTAEPRKGEAYVFGPADQTNLPLAILGNQDTRQTPDAREALSKSQDSSRDDDGTSNLADPLVSQEQASRAERASDGPTEEVRSATVDEKTTLPSSQAQTPNTGPDSTLATGDAHLTNADMPATSSLQNQDAQPLAATQAPTTQAPPASSQNVHADSFENIEASRQSLKAPPAPVTSSAAFSDTLNGEPGTATFQTPQEASFDLSGGNETTTTQGDQLNPLLNGDLSTSQPVRPSESVGFKGTNSEWKLEGASTYEKSKAQHQIDRYEIPSPKDNNKEANEAIKSDLWPKEDMESSEESEHQEQADQAVVQSPVGNMKEQTKTHDTETGAIEERGPRENTNQTNSEVSRMEALDSSGKQTSGVQLRGANRKDASNSADDAPDDIQTCGSSEDNLTSYEEANKVQQQSEDKTQGGETEAPLSETVQQNGRGLPENSYQNNSGQSQAKASDKSAEKLSPGIQNKNKSSSGLDSPTDGTKSGDAEDSPGELQ